MSLSAVILLVLIGSAAVLQALRWHDKRRAAKSWRRLARTARNAAPFFELSMVEDLPDPARQYFLYTIRIGTPIRTVTEIAMSGEIGLGTKDKPRYMPMKAEQILAPPRGLVWKLDAGRALMRITGSDGFDGATSWVRFWLANTIPLVRAGGSRDHARAAFGRLVAEAVFWAPAALLPKDGVSWEAVNADVARATVSHGSLVQTVDVSLAADGRPTMVVIRRWSDANPEKTYRVQPFGGFLSEFRDFDGYRLPTQIEGGNFIGTDAYFPFYKARVDSLRFLAASRSRSRIDRARSIRVR